MQREQEIRAKNEEKRARCAGIAGTRKKGLSKECTRSAVSVGDAVSLGIFSMIV